MCTALALHRGTNQPQAWIAETHGLRSAANVNQRVKNGSQAANRRTLFHK